MTLRSLLIINIAASSLLLITAWWRRKSRVIEAPVREGKISATLQSGKQRVNAAKDVVLESAADLRHWYATREPQDMVAND